MQNQNCYLEFEIENDKNFIELKYEFELVKEAKNNGIPQPDDFWVNNFPDYSLKQFYFLDGDIKPRIPTAHKGEFTWHFYSLTELLQTNYDIEYIGCYKLSDKCGRLEYAPFGYSYGGITGLITFVRSLNCKPTIVDDGTSVYNIMFKDDGDFAIRDLNDPQRADSSTEKFEGLDLLNKFWNRQK